MDKRPTRHKALKDFESSGEAAVRNAYNRGAYRNELKNWAREWLDEQGRKRDVSSQAENLEIARSSKDAAWEAARAAKNANNLATLALITAIISIALSVFVAFVKG